MDQSHYLNAATPEPFIYPASERNPYYHKIKAFGSYVLTHNDTERYRGRWISDVFEKPGTTRLFVEIGCGHGHFLSEEVQEHPENAYIGVEYSYKPLYDAAKKIATQKLANARLMLAFAERFPYIFREEEIDFIYILFPDPWPKKRQEKKRLLSPEFLSILASCMKPQGRIWIKTDHEEYFSWFRDRFRRDTPPFNLEYASDDLHHSPHEARMRTTHYERKFLQQSKRIFFAELIRK